MKLITFILLGIFSTMAFSIETLKYDVLKKEKNIEIRLYKKFIAASVSFESKDEFDKKAFRILADYIFGNNIKMTSPVFTKGEKIGMTSPVLMEEKASIWTMTFSMPSRYTLENLPKPTNKNINISEVNESKMAAIRFRGFMSDSNFSKNETELREWLDKMGFEHSNDFIRAGYNPPWTLPFFRRNEVLTIVK